MFSEQEQCVALFNMYTTTSTSIVHDKCDFYMCFYRPFSQVAFTIGYTECFISVMFLPGCTLMEQDTTHEIKRSSGESALLPCLCSSLHAKPESVRWTMTTSRSGSSYTDISNTTGPYRGRVQMLNRHSPGNVSLLISDLSEEDQGLYVCVVDKHYNKYFNLLVKGKQLALFYGLIVDSFSH